jgi:integrase
MAAQQCRPSTLAMYDSHVRNHVVPMLGGRPMDALRRTDISTFVVDLTHKQLATATVVTIYRILAMILRSAVHDRLLVASPCYKTKLPGIPTRRLQAFTADEVGALLDHTPSRDYAVLALGVGTGMRQGEVLGLTMPHLRLLARELSVEQQCRVVPGGPPEITPELKTAASRRVLPLSAFVVTALARHIELFAWDLSRRCSSRRAVGCGGAGRSTRLCGSLLSSGLGRRGSTASTRCGTPTPRR